MRIESTTTQIKISIAKISPRTSQVYQQLYDNTFFYEQENSEFVRRLSKKICGGSSLGMSFGT